MGSAEPENRRGAALLLAHCDAIARMLEPPRPDARERLVAALGPELAARLVGALGSPTPVAGGAGAQTSASRP